MGPCFEDGSYIPWITRMPNSGPMLVGSTLDTTACPGAAAPVLEQSRRRTSEEMFAALGAARATALRTCWPVPTLGAEMFLYTLGLYGTSCLAGILKSATRT